MKLSPTFKRILLFILLIVVLNEGVKLYFYKVGVQQHMIVKQERRFNAYKGDLNYLFLGHSRAARAIDTSQIDGSYVYFSGAESNVNTYYKLKYLLENHEDRISIVVLPIGFTSVNLSRPDKITNSFYWSKYVDYTELGRLTGEKSTYWKTYLKAKLFPYYEYPYIRVMEKYGDLRIEKSDSTFLNADSVKRLKLIRKLLVHQDAFSSVYDKTAIQYIEKTIDLVKAYNKQLVYVKYPLTIEYVKAVETYNPKWLSKQKEIDRRLSQNSDVLFYNGQNIFENKIMYFKDSHHLNEAGRIKFTTSFKEFLDENGLK